MRRLSKTPDMCFVAGTQVVVEDEHGNQATKPIEQIQPGDMVWSRCDLTGDEGFKPVLQTFVTRPVELVHLTYRRAAGRAHGSAFRGAKAGESGDGDSDPDSSTIVGTPNHPFWSVSRQAWIELGHLQLGECLLLADGSEAVVAGLAREYAPAVFDNWKPGHAKAGTLGTPVCPETGTFTTYNFEVADWHTYFVTVTGNAVWVHNTGKLCPTLLEEAAKRYSNLGLRGDRFLETGQRIGKFSADDVARIKDVAAGGIRRNNALGHAHADDVARKIEAAGGRVVGREVTVRTPLGDRRQDIVAELPNGNLVGVEAKFGGAKLSPGQVAKDNAIRAGTGAFVGGKAATAELIGKKISEVITWR